MRALCHCPNLYNMNTSTTTNESTMNLKRQTCVPLVAEAHGEEDAGNGIIEARVEAVVADVMSANGEKSEDDALKEYAGLPFLSCCACG